MKKTIIATALAAVIAAPAASAVEIYKDANNEATIGGYLGARLINTQSDSDHLLFANGSSRINFNFSHQLNNGWKVNSTFEWGVNPFGTTHLVYNNDSKFDAQNDDFLTNRLAFVGLSHDKYGSLTFGKQWGVWYNVVSATDNGFIWGGSASGVYTFGNDGATNGVGRADNAIQYNYSVGNFSLALQTQLQHDVAYDLPQGETAQLIAPFGTPVKLQKLEYGNTYGMSAAYTMMDKLQFAIGGNIGKFDASLTDNTETSRTDYIYGASVTWGNWDDQGLFASANVNKNQWHQTDANGFLIPDAVGVETYVSYNFANGIRPYFIFNHLQANEDYGVNQNQAVEQGHTLRQVNEYKEQYVALGVQYQWDSSVLFYLEGKRDFSDYKYTDKNDKNEISHVRARGDNGIGLGMRYTF